MLNVNYIKTVFDYNPVGKYSPIKRSDWGFFTGDSRMNSLEQVILSCKKQGLSL